MDKELEKNKKTISVAIAIQKEGQATVEEIKEKLEFMKNKKQIDFSITENQVIRECKKLQKKGLISTNYVQQEGRSVLAYSPSKPLFQRGIEGMQFKDIVDSEYAKDLIQELDKKKGANKGRLPDIRDYYEAQLKWEVTDEIGVLGFIPRTKEGYLEHYRNSKEEIVFLPKHFRAYIRNNLRIANKSNLHNYMRFDYGSVEMNGHKTSKVDHYILDGRQGRGQGTHEAIPKGAIIKTSIGVPEKGGLTPKEFENFIKEIAEKPIRGFGGASSQGFGKLKLIECKIKK